MNYARIRIFPIQIKNSYIFPQPIHSKKKKIGIYPTDYKSLEKAEGHLISLCETQSNYSREIKPPVTKWEERTPCGKDRDVRRKPEEGSYLLHTPGLTQEAVFLRACVCHFETCRAINWVSLVHTSFWALISETIWQIKSDGAKTKWFIAEIFTELLWVQ